MHIAIAGNIGSGKTTLAGLLGRHYGWDIHYEDVEDNPYLADFYNDMRRWSFNLQVYFLKSRFSQIVKIREGNTSVIQDRTIYEDSVIFAANLFDMGLMSPRDYENYTGLFNLMSSLIAPPDLLIYLRASVPTLVRQIEMRGREYESSIRLDYLRRLNERYEGWIKNYRESNLLIVDVDNNDFIKDRSNLSAVIDKVDSKINGLF
ncbi:deoxynucleoside kinase [Marinilabilia salmonicolor]|jgi:deoxyadenosine/deoxycytidine kinase|uniref:Deoxyadenosine/deoxycytidine kinase n=1 Tax=Marinilabilia salmonicolor TaxID=989 RepID=A0A2T0XSE2_9BACT|nr:deoxynucleoside kinase [Marinilabilia salmonicolor]PRZ01816.1 deoxyadenosine/deoxycytidine kinase [Marinilabilia salmonicolor]RCW29852.1 deoxyadenosine/deoxycytidine kinase [Marinilabilia salmonicolor]